MPERITIQSPDEIVAHFTLSEESIATSPIWGADQGAGDLVFRESAPAGTRKRVTMEFPGLDLEQIDQLTGISSDTDSFVPDSASRFIFNENPLGSSDTVIQSGGKGFAGTAQTIAASTGSIVVNEGVRYRDFTLGEHIRLAVAADIASQNQSRETQLMYDDAPNNMNTTPAGSLSTVRNPEFFLDGVYDFSGVCFSRWLSNGGWPQPGWYNTGLCCAINERFAIVADHAKGVGTDDYLFMRPDGTIDVMTPQSRHTISTLANGGDLALIYFDSEFHSSIKKYKCMPANWVRDYAPSLLNTDFRGVIPTYRQAKHDADGQGGVPFTVINELSYKLANGALQNKRTYAASTGTVGYDWGTQQGIGGDSGHPSFLSINGDLVLFATAKSVTNDGDISDYITEIQNTMVSVGAAAGDPNDYSTLDTVDLSSFINFDANLFDNGCAADPVNAAANDTNWKGFVASRNTPADGHYSDHCIEVVMDPGDSAASRGSFKLSSLPGFGSAQDGQTFRIFCDVRHAGGTGVGQVHMASNHYLDDLVELAELTSSDTDWRTVTGTFTYNHNDTSGSVGSHLVIHEKGSTNNGVTVRIGNIRIQPVPEEVETFYLDTGYYQESKRLDLRIIGPSQFESVASPYTVAEPGKDFSMEILAIGGVYPYKYEIDADPQGSGLTVQSVLADDGNGTLDPLHASNENYGLLTGVLSSGSYSVTVRVTDQLGDSLTQQFTIDCSDNHVVHVKPSGSDSNPGTEASPYRTLAYAMESNSDKIIRLYDDGAGGNATYDVEDVAGTGRLQISDSAGRNFIMGDPDRAGTITLHCPAHGGFQIATGQSDVDEFCVKDIDTITSDADGSVDFTTFMAIRSNANRVRLLRMGDSISFNQNDSGGTSNCGFWYEANPGQECAFSGGTFTGPSCAIAHRFDAEYSLVEKIRCLFTSVGQMTGTTGGVFNFKQSPQNAETRVIDIQTSITDNSIRPLKMKGQPGAVNVHFNGVHLRYIKVAAPNMRTSQMFNGESVSTGYTMDNFWAERCNFQSDWHHGINRAGTDVPTNSGVDHCVFNEVPEVDAAMPVTNEVDPDTYSTDPLDGSGDLVAAASASDGLAGYAIKAVYSNNGVAR